MGFCLPYFEARVEDGQRNWWKEDGRASLFEVQRDGRVLVPATAAIGLRHLQELRGPVTCRIHGWQWRRHVGQGGELRTENGGCRWRQEEVSRLGSDHILHGLGEGRCLIYL